MRVNKCLLNFEKAINAFIFPFICIQMYLAKRQNICKHGCIDTLPTIEIVLPHANEPILDLFNFSMIGIKYSTAQSIFFIRI